MAHSIGLKIDHELPVGNVDIKIVVTRDGERLGVREGQPRLDRLEARQGEAHWSLTWQQFDDLMREFGHPPGRLLKLSRLRAD